MRGFSLPSAKLAWFRLLAITIMLSSYLAACQPAVDVFDPAAPPPEEIPSGLSPEQAASLASLEQIDEFPLYVMTYAGEYYLDKNSPASENFRSNPPRSCSLFAAYGDPADVVFGRNFDWDFSPALLLFMEPPDAYASVSMVDIHYLGFRGENSYRLTDLPLEERIGLLEAPELPFDGINEAGLAVGMAAVPDGGMVSDPDKETIGSVLVIRKILDQAATIEEALEIFRQFNIEMHNNYLHYLITEASGRSVLVEFSQGEMVVIPNQQTWQIATNFLISEAWGDYGVHCNRYGTIREKMEETGGDLNARQALALLEQVSQPHTQWSAVYRISAGEIWLVMGKAYNEIHKIDLGFD